MKNFIKNWIIGQPVGRKLAKKFARLDRFLSGKGFLAPSSAEVERVAEFLDSEKVKLCVDVGANVGRYSKALRERFPGARIVSVEPSPANAAGLREHFADDPKLEVVEAALAEEEGMVTLFADLPGSSKASLTRRELGHFDVSFGHADEVRAIRFENLWRDSLEGGDVDLLKLDVEGHELEALLGAGEAIKSVKVVQFEFGGCNIDTRTFFRDFWKFFRPRGFDLYRIAPQELCPIKEYEEDLEHFLTANYLAVNRRFSCRVQDSVTGDQPVRYFLFSIKQPRRIAHVFSTDRMMEVDNAADADVIFTMISCAHPRLLPEEIEFLNETGKPVVVLERADSCVVWFRQFGELRNLRLVLKNRNFRNLEDNNKTFFLWRMHLERIREAMGLPEEYNEAIPDASSGVGRGKLPEMTPRDQDRVRTVPWDFMSSPLGAPVRDHGDSMVPFAKRDIDVFCVSSPKEGILGKSREAIKREVERIGREHGLVVETGPLSRSDFADRLRRSKISVSANGWGEQVHADWYAVFSAVALFKPDCGYVRMVPDLYLDENVTFFHHGLADLEEKILGVLNGFSEREERLLALREEFRSQTEDQWRENFVSAVESAIAEGKGQK